MRMCRYADVRFVQRVKCVGRCILPAHVPSVTGRIKSLSLPDFVVNVDPINIFKSRLDKYWINQDIVFDYTADRAGTGDRSEYRSSY